MQIEVFSLCDAATVDGSGKLNILGAFDTIWVREIPTVYPQFAIVTRIRFDSSERGEHKVSVNLVDADGHHIVPSANGVIKIEFPTTQRSGSANSILNIQMLKFEKPGEYSIDLLIDGQIAGSLPLFVMEQSR